jgi:hypothetical protein
MRPLWTVILLAALAPTLQQPAAARGDGDELSKPRLCELNGDCDALDANFAKQAASRAERLARDGLDREDTGVRVPAIWASESERAMHCPECPLSLLTRLDEPPRVAAERTCAAIPEGVVDCVATLELSVAERQLLRYLDLGTELDDHLRDEGVDMQGVEGKSFTYLEKLRLMRRLVLHPLVETVCEVGFNAGHSALLWLSGGARRVLSFELGQYGYSSHAVGWLSERYPGRLQVVMGDSLRTVPSFAAMWPDERCNLLFVDGGHLYRHAMGDLANLRALRNGSFHYLLVDDTNQGEVATAWRDYKSDGHAVESETVWSDYSEVVIVDANGGDRLLDPDPGSIISDWRSSLSWGYYTH